MPYIPHTDEDVREMLSVIGASSVEDLFAEIVPALRPKSFDLPDGLSEQAVLARMEGLSAKNASGLKSFLGAGFYDHHIPSVVDAITSRGEFYTAYTPYQPEASQGTLQAIYEFQSAMCRLMEMDCANASVYDGGSAIFEAMMMAARKTRRRRFVISESVSPIYRIMLTSYTINLNFELVTVPHRDGKTDTQALAAAIDKNTAAVLVQNPNFFGTAADLSDLFAAARAAGAVSVLSTYPVLQSVLKTPGAMGADVAVAEGQSLGLPLSFGGPYLGVMTSTKELVRQMPGRIVGRTTDLEGKTGYVLTLQAREQHIRRAKATSNICSNQALCALRALVHLCCLGEEGMRRTAAVCIERAHYAAERLTAIPGVSLLSDAPFGNEFAVRLPIGAFEAIDKLTAKGVVPGFPLGRYYEGLENCLLVACTEKNSKEDIGVMAEMLGGLLA
ncbi:glycine dehydrogenase (decarboxylating) subunit 1 [Desulfovibrio sp. X2]|uniref:aminomethyl-transferring glycine dehydrogenase subunit GcvPA n=1 Tax=Desulfovibrio sp. X2 TaxID=941449 RepID=UPI000358DC53|nr:aminomethyl-transferring glycine dehydrogenase subunit GcvPA [Desulfovibrio sp. X2]EPR44256.1 glycine dehydrogenase (decarboxylating) subunit 1 [Desulfovibrio sp. X2]